MTTHPTLFIAPTRIGDAVLTSAVLQHIAASAPLARVTIATSPLAAPLFAGYPALERIIPVVKQRYNRHWLALGRETFGTRWHSVWDMRNSILSYVLRARHRHRFTLRGLDIPKVQQYARGFGLASLPYPILWPRPEDAAFAQAMLPAGEKVLLFAPIANWAPKEWPLTHFIALAQQLLVGDFAGYRPAIICAGHERERALPMLDALAHHQPIDLTTGDAHLLGIFACMQRASAFVGNDSGLMHMAAAAGIPTLGLFGPTPATVYQPWGARANFITAAEKDLAKLEVAHVATIFTEMLRRA
jgi:heptosyltransferase-3